MISNYFTSAIIFCLFPDNKYTKNMLVNWYSEKLLVYILKLKTSKTKFNLSELKIIVKYSASFSILKNLDITVDYKKLKEEWKLVDITEKHLAIFKEYEKVYAILNEFNEELALNLFVCRVFPKIIEQKDDYVLMSLEFGDYENLLLKIEKQKDGKIIVSNDLPKKSETKIFHLRPHARKSKYVINGIEYGNGNCKDTDELPNGDKMTKQSFWLNNSYIIKIIENTIKKVEEK